MMSNRNISVNPPHTAEIRLQNMRAQIDILLEEETNPCIVAQQNNFVSLV
jgi:hypothetical protein